jgi:SRSO17 transposase
VGKVANCQEGVFAVYASPQGQTFLDCRLYLHASWFAEEFRTRWQQCGISPATTFQTEPQLALEMLQGLVARGVLPFRWVAADEHFGQIPAFLDGVAALDKWYLVELPADTRVWLRTPAVEPPGPGLFGRPRTKPRVVLQAPRPHEVRQLAAQLPRGAWKRYWIKEGSQGPMVAEFAFLRVTSIREQLPGPRVWLMLRRSLGTEPQLKFFFSNAPTTTAPCELAQLSGWRWPIETTFEEGKGEIGLDHYETRSWRGWHHQMAQSFMADYFLIPLRLKFKKRPSDDNRTSPRLDRQCLTRGRRPLGQDTRDRRIPPAAQPFGVPLASQKHIETASSARFCSTETQSLQVM